MQFLLNSEYHIEIAECICEKKRNAKLISKVINFGNFQSNFLRNDEKLIEGFSKKSFLPQ